MKKSIVLCADDYGQAPAISQGIIALLASGRLSAVSCMVNTPYWSQESQKLIAFSDSADIGLHFNLTEGLALSDLYAQEYGKNLFSLPNLMRRAFFNQLNCGLIEVELHAQIDVFFHAMGRLPDFIDGHQHVHQFPVIRQALFNVYQQRLASHAPYIRWVNEKPEGRDMIFNLKKWIIYASGARLFGEGLASNRIRHNPSFAGIYAFRQAKHYPALFRGFLAKVGNQGLIMCHPGFSSKQEDPIAEVRQLEYDYLASTEFLQDCAKYNVILARA